MWRSDKRRALYSQAMFFFAYNEMHFCSVPLAKVTYYEERMLEVEDELGRVKEDRRQASIQVSVF